MRQHLRQFASVVGLAASAVLMLALTTGTGVAGAAHAFSLRRLPRRTGQPRGARDKCPDGHLALTGPDVMASIVAVMAFAAHSPSWS